MKKIFFLFILILSSPLFAQTRTVNLTSATFSSINYSSITAALTGLSSGTIWVAAGTYKEAELIIPSGVTVIGGFPATTTNLAQRIYPGVATTAQLSVLDGNYAHRVATVSGMLDGFFITKGYAYANGTNGGGVLIDGGIVQNCILTNNIASSQAPTPATIPGTFVASVGDIYCTDGTILKPTYTLNQTTGKIVASLSGGIPATKTAQGIVFYVDNSATLGKFYVMGKFATTPTSVWLNSGPMCDFTPPVTTSNDALNDFSGRVKSDSISNQFLRMKKANTISVYSGWYNSNDNTTYPVAFYCLDFNIPSGTLGQWYLPAAGELYQLVAVGPQMDACARDILGWISGTTTTMFQSGAYWSSSEVDASNVWILNLYSFPSSWGVSIVSKTQGGVAIPVLVKTLTTQ